MRYVDLNISDCLAADDPQNKHLSTIIYMLLDKTQYEFVWLRIEESTNTGHFDVIKSINLNDDINTMWLVIRR